jgi:hypothetical protein
MNRLTNLEAIDRLNRQRAILSMVKRQLDPRAVINETGGGCTAIFVPVGELTEEMRGAWPTYWLITDDAEAPDRHDVEVQVGFYSWDADGNDRWLCFSVPDLQRALDLINSYACHQM